ncbi:MAG: hypothetical protein KatS3mg102_2740 [Planctomycetota bacterium]|nr:MAG: hypothetical protein KatS3mg102_2740 [Planctomycetota bacterium]
MSSPGTTPRRELRVAGFFRPQHARRIDAALEYLAAARAAGAISAGAFKLLLAGVVCGADRVANICGTYGAFLKRWQPNTAGPFALVLPLPPAGPLGRAHCEDANQLVRRLEQPLDVLYIDPPYNGREYCANYHVLEVIARRPFLDAAALRRLEASIYGKTGLVPYERSRYCRRRQVAAALAELVAAAPARHVVVSYSEEGLLGAEEIRQALARGLGVAPSAIEHHRLSLRRFRSDADGRSARLDGERRTRPRRYRQLEGRGRDELQEWLFYARRPLAAAGRTA